MSDLWVSTRIGSSPRTSPIARWLGATLLLAVEGVALSLRYETPRISPGSAWWFALLEHGPKLVFPGALAIVLMATLVVFRSVAISGKGRLEAARQPFWATNLVSHLAALAIFVFLTNRVCESDLLASRWPAAWVLSWFVVGLAVWLTWLNVLQPDLWRTLGGWTFTSIMTAGLVVTLGGAVLSQWATQLWIPLAWGTIALVRTVLGLIRSDVVCDLTRNMVGVQQFAVEIAPGCSGYEGIGLVGTFLTAYVIWSRRSLRWPHAWLLIALGILVIWLVNAARITALILIGASGSPEIAMGGFHSQAGSLGFLITSLGLVAVSRRSRFFMIQPVESQAGLSEEVSAESDTEINPTAAYLVPFLVVVAATMATGAVSAGFDSLYPVRIVAGGVALWYYRRTYSGRLFDGSWWAALVGLGVFGLWMLLEPANPTGAQALKSGFTRLPQFWAAIWLGFRVVGSVVVVPLVEELAFRGYLTRRLIASDFESVPLGRFTWFSFFLSSLIFGLLHGRWFAGTLAGLIYAGVYYRRGRVGDAALAHAVTNACIAVVVLATNDWTYWS